MQCMIFVYYVPQHHLHGLCQKGHKHLFTRVFPFAFIWISSAFRMFLYQSFTIYMGVYMSVNFSNYFNGIFCSIGNFKSFRFYQQYIACSALNFLKVFSGFSPLQWSAAKLSKRFDDEMCFPPVNTFCCHVWNLCLQKAYNLINLEISKRTIDATIFSSYLALYLLNTKMNIKVISGYLLTSHLLER